MTRHWLLRRLSTIWHKASPSMRLFLISLIILSIPLLLRFSSDLPLIAEGPSRRHYEVAHNLIAHGSFTPQSMYDLHNQLIETTRTDHSSMWQDAYSIRPNGDLFPVHSVVPPLFLAPFLAIFGDFAIPALNIIVLALLITSIHSIAQRIRGDLPWTVTLFATLLGSQMIFYTGGIAYDSLGALFVVGGFALAFRCPWLGGALVGLSCFLRVTNVSYLALLALAFPRSSALAFLGGGALSLGGLAIWNIILWGGPLTTSYHRTPSIVDGASVFLMTQSFAFHILQTNWGEKLFSPTCGLLLFNPLLLLIPLVRWRKPWDPLTFSLILNLVTSTIVMFSYSYWDASGGGNRYLMPAICLALPVCLPLVADAASRYQRLKSAISRAVRERLSSSARSQSIINSK